MKIGIIGCGNIGGTLARHWVKAGHEVILSSRHPEKLRGLAKELGSSASTGTPERAAKESDVVLLSIPLGGIKDLSSSVCEDLRGKIVMDTCNPYPERDGEAANEVFREGRGTGVWTARQIPGARIVRAFNSVPARTLQTEAHRVGDPVGVPLASDDLDALRTVATLVRDAGFGPWIVGALDRAREFDPGTRPYASNATLSELGKILQPTPSGTVVRPGAIEDQDLEGEAVAARLSEAEGGLKAIRFILLAGAGTWLAYRFALKVRDWRESKSAA